MHRQARGNTLQIQVQAGRLERPYPPRIAVGADQRAELTVTGGLGYVPFTFTSVTDYRGWVVFVERAGQRTALDQSVLGNDYWQTEREADGRYSITCNICLDTPDDQPEPCRLDLRTCRQPASTGE